MRHWIVLVHMLIATSITVHASPPPDSTTSVEKTVMLSNGQRATYTCHFNRNALSDFRFLDSSIIALTASGSLLQFDIKTISLHRERTDNIPVTYLDTPDTHGILISYANGHIARLTSRLDTIDTHLQVPVNPVWFIPIADSTNTLHILSVSYTEGEGVNIIFDSRSGRKTPVTVQTSGSVGTQLTSFLLADSLLWFGNDVGEFGGYIGYYNLRSGIIRQLSDHNPIYGITRISDGSILAYGGLSHFGVGNAHIFRLHPETLDTLYHSPSKLLYSKDTSFSITAPIAPVTHIIDNPANRTLIVQAYSDVFHTDYSGTFWHKDTGLVVRYKPGRRDAIGSYPAVTAAALFPTQPERILYATTSDGFIILDKTGQQNYTLPNEPNILQVQSILPYRTGPIFFPVDSYREIPWQYNSERWKPANTFSAPPLPDRSYCYWMDYLLTGTIDTLYSLWKTGCRIDNIFVFQHNDTMTPCPPIPYYLQFSSTITTPDGKLWHCNANEFQYIDRAGQFYSYPVENPPLPDEGLLPGYLGLYPTLLNQVGPPWYITDKYRNWLFSIQYRSGDTNIAVRRLIPAVPGDSNICVTAGCLLSSDTLLLATNRGFLIFDSGSQNFSTFSSPVSDEPVYCILPDEHGNVWLAGRGLWKWTSDNQSLIDFRPIPELGSGNITTLALWKDQLIIAVERGLIIIVDTP